MITDIDSLSKTQRAIMMALCDGTETPSNRDAVTVATNIPRSTVLMNIRKLEKMGYARRDKLPRATRGRSVVVFQLTGTGREIVEKLKSMPSDYGVNREGCRSSGNIACYNA